MTVPITDEHLARREHMWPSLHVSTAWPLSSLRPLVHLCDYSTDHSLIKNTKTDRQTNTTAESILASKLPSGKYPSIQPPGHPIHPAWFVVRTSHVPPFTTPTFGHVTVGDAH